ncbi:MAG: hypothetical protein R2755_28805 [Acidimicrobiales bacterium]
MNQRREFFYASPSEVRDFLLAQRDVLPNGAVVEYELDPVADEWFQSQSARRPIPA